MRQAIVSVVAVISTGCATLITGGGHSQTVRFASDPPGATVFVDDNRIGLTPIVAPLTRKDSHVVRMEMDGHQPATAKITAGPNLWAYGNCAFGLVGIIGTVIDLSSGSMDGVLSPNDLRLTLKKSADPNHLSSIPPCSPAPASYADAPRPYGEECWPPGR